jgi:hypothetical protein
MLLERTSMEIKYRTQFGELLEHFHLYGDAVEVGVAEGRNAQVLISSPAIKKLYLIDNWSHLDQVGDGGHPESWHSNNFKEAQERVQPWKEKAVFLKGMSTEMINHIPNKSLVFGYVDGDHSYNGAYNDLQNLYFKVKTGGIIAGHDYLNMSYGVNNAVRSFIGFHKYSLTDVHITEEDGDQSMVSFWFIKK